MDDSNEGRAYNRNSFSLAGRWAYSHITGGAYKQGGGGLVRGILRYLIQFPPSFLYIVLVIVSFRRVLFLCGI